MIKVLDSNISDKIAAGEVIERPLSIVKELLENSIDAGASSVIVEIRNGGKSYIRVTDDGCGIPSDEVSTAFLRHATSKISGISDLENINSLGFRGEALASIAAVSRVTIVTRTEDETAGTKLLLHGGKEISNNTVGANKGTTIVVEDVFYNTPARRKFMGTDAREASVIIELIEQYAICYDDIRFMLINNGNTVFTTNGDGNKHNAITTVFKSSDYANLIPVSSDILTGYISNPGITRSTRKGQLFFVNGRLVDSAVIEKGIEKGYGDRVFDGFPIAILFLDIDPNTIDVNIHPAKKEIKFLNKDVIISNIADAINSVMDSQQSIPGTIISRNSAHSLSSTDINNVGLNINDNNDKHDIKPVIDIKEYLSSLDRDIKPPQTFTDADSVQEDNVLNEYEKAHYDMPVKEYTGPKPFAFEDLEFKGYIFNAYIIMQARDNIYILDQHAAHERIFYERLMTNFSNMEQNAQPILTPFIVNVSADIYASDRAWMQPLINMGFDISDFGPDMFVVKGIPQYMELIEAESFVKSYINDSDSFSNNKTVIDKLIMKSCKSAVKANEHLSEMEIRDLIEMLSKCKNPFSCPHGRPTFIKVSKYEIERSFRRK